MAVVAKLDMADKTHHETTLSRSDAGDYLRSLGVELGDESHSWTVPVGNKDVETQPDSPLDVETIVNERSRLMGNDVTEVTIQLSWNERDEPEEDAR